MKTTYAVGDLAIIIECEKFKHDKSQRYINETVITSGKGNFSSAPEVVLYSEFCTNNGNITNCDRFRCDTIELLAVEDYIDIIEENLDKLQSRYETRTKI